MFCTSCIWNYITFRMTQKLDTNKTNGRLFLKIVLVRGKFNMTEGGSDGPSQMN